MSKHIINAGATSQRFYIYLQDSTTGQGEAGVTAATCYYLRDSVSGTMPAAVTLTFGAVFASPGTYPTWTSGQVREIGYMPGIYLIDIPDAVFAAGARNVVVQIVPTAGTPWLPVNLEFTLSAVNIYDSVRMGMTALPNTAVTTNGSLITSGTGTDQLSVTGGRATANTTQWGGTNVTGMPMPTYNQPTGFLTATFPTGTIANTTNITAGTITTVSGNVNGSVASVTGNVGGSVGSVAGNISGNVVGSVNSVVTAVTVGAINSNVITAASIASGAIDADAIATGAIDADAIASDAITAAKIATGAIDADAIATGAIDADAIAADAITSAKIADNAITIRLSTDGTASEGRIIAGTIASDTYNALLADYTTANTFGARLVRTLSTSPSNEVTITGSHHIACDVHELQPLVITSGDFTAGAINANALATDAVTEIADGILARDIGSLTNAGVLNERTVRSALRTLRNRTSITGTTLTVTNETDNLTTGVAWTATLTTNPLADPVTGIDPA